MITEILKLSDMIISIITGISSVIITVIGAVYAYKDRNKTKRDTTRSRLAKDAYAFYFVEKEALRRIAMYTPDKTLQAIQRELRDAAENDPENKLTLRPKQAAREFEKYIID